MKEIQKEALTLKEFLGQLKQVFEVAYPLQYHITSEIARINIHQQSGHCFLDLVEKEEDKVVAKIRAVIWKGILPDILKRFRDTVGEDIKEGMKVLLVVEVRFHEVYGLALNIVDIDPSYTLGEFVLTRKKIIAQLEKEGLLARNKQLSFPLVPQRIAVISSESSAGYEDFLNTLHNNPHHYRFFVSLFPAYMQGELAERSILTALQNCLARTETDKYDILVIIRGGGDNIDLHCFDSYNIGKAIAEFPLPVLSGIGHTRDETIVDVVSYRKLITPTATGEFIIDRVNAFDDYISNLTNRIIDITRSTIVEQKTLVSNLEKHLNIFTAFIVHKAGQHFKITVSNFKTNVSKCITTREFFLKRMPDALSSALRTHLKGQGNFLERQEDRISLINPVNILKRGYSITFKDGKVIKEASSVKAGDIIETNVCRGTIKSKVEGVKNDRE